MRVVVLGAGYAGVTLARELEGRLPDEVDLRVVDETGTHLVQHELHRLVRRPGLADDIELPLEEILADAGITRARVDGVDPGARTVALEDGEGLSYDVAAVCLGADPDFHDLPGLADRAVPLKRIEHAREIREAVLPVLDAGGRIVVGGAGLSGVQLAGELAEMRDAADAEGTDADAGIYLLEQSGTIAPGFDRGFRDAVRRELEQRDVAIWTDAAVQRATDDAVELADGGSMAYDALCWTGGIRGDEALGRERPVVRSDLRLAERTFALGDAARVFDDHGERVPSSARTAIAQARVAADNVVAAIEHARGEGTAGFGPRLDRYTMGQPRWIVSVGDGAVAQVGQAVVTGRAANALKTSVGAGYLGRVGPVRQALDLVRSELGLAGDEQGERRRGEDSATGSGDEPTDEDEEFAALPDGVVEELRDE